MPFGTDGEAKAYLESPGQIMDGISQMGKEKGNTKDDMTGKDAVEWETMLVGQHAGGRVQT